jgi:hypothetical protein
MISEVRGDMTLCPFGTASGSPLSNVVGSITPPLTAAANADATCTGLTAMPWPKPIVMVLMSPQREG